jgi:protein tyrosine phosphatase (PTP) superfamily phosphohydrolase (DUF442 family)
MRVGIAILTVAVSTFASLTVAVAQQSSHLSTALERSKNVDVPVVLCIDDKPTAAGQPSGDAYAKAAANGYRSVLTLRTNKDGVDISRERFMVEQRKMRYFNIASTAKLPRPEQVDEFLRLVRDKANHPMLLNCAFAERVAPFMMIFRITEQGWSEEKALDEASRSGLKGDQLKKFARDYLAQRNKK